MSNISISVLTSSSRSHLSVQRAHCKHCNVEHLDFQLPRSGMPFPGSRDFQFKTPLKTWTLIHHDIPFDQRFVKLNDPMIWTGSSFNMFFDIFCHYLGTWSNLTILYFLYSSNGWNHQPVRCRIALKNHLAREPWFGGILVGQCRSSTPLKEKAIWILKGKSLNMNHIPFLVRLVNHYDFPTCFWACCLLGTSAFGMNKIMQIPNCYPNEATSIRKKRMNHWLVLS